MVLLIALGPVIPPRIVCLPLLTRPTHWPCLVFKILVRYTPIFRIYTSNIYSGLLTLDSFIPILKHLPGLYLDKDTYVSPLSLMEKYIC